MRRPLILDAAFEVMLERGFDRASMALIAERAGVTKPVIYDSFPSKEALFEALRARERDRIFAAVYARMPPDPEEDAEESLAQGMAAFLNYVRDNPLAFKLIVLGEGASGEAVDEIQRRRSENVHSIAVTLEAVAGGNPENPATATQIVANILGGASEGIARAVMVDPDRFDIERTATLFARVLVRGTSSVPQASR